MGAPFDAALSVGGPRTMPLAGSDDSMAKQIGKLAKADLRFSAGELDGPVDRPDSRRSGANAGWPRCRLYRGIAP